MREWVTWKVKSGNEQMESEIMKVASDSVTEGPMAFLMFIRVTRVYIMIDFDIKFYSFIWVY